MFRLALLVSILAFGLAGQVGPGSAGAIKEGFEGQNLVKDINARFEVCRRPENTFRLSPKARSGRQSLELSITPQPMFQSAPGTAMQDVGVQHVFIGSCTNSRIEDLRAAAAVANGRKVADGVRAMVVPGSGLVKRQAEAEGLDRIFTAAGFDWREPGCSMCLAMNPDKVPPGERCASTSNRNFVGRQGPGARTHLLSPAMAAAAAVTGRLADVRDLMGGK